MWGFALAVLPTQVMLDWYLDDGEACDPEAAQNAWSVQKAGSAPPPAAGVLFLTPSEVHAASSPTQSSL